MSEEQLRKWNFVSIIAIIVSALFAFIAMTILWYSAKNDTFLSVVPDIVIRLFVLMPWGVLMVSSISRLYLFSEIKKLESLKDSKNKTIESKIRTPS